jgi:glutamine amidotransferase
MLHHGSEESPDSTGLGVLDGNVGVLIGDVKRPQMQWNRLEPTVDAADHPMFHGLGGNPWAYFVHGYAAPVGPATVATCRYGAEVCAAEAVGDLWACQFHPEKSGAAGLQVLANFVALVEARRIGRESM